MSSVDPQGMSVRFLETRTLPQLDSSPNQAPIQATYFNMPMKNETDEKYLEKLTPEAFTSMKGGPLDQSQYQVMTKLHSRITWDQVCAAGKSVVNFAQIGKGMLLSDTNKARQLNSTEAKYLAWRILAGQPVTKDLSDSQKIQFLSSLVFLMANQQEAEAAKKKKA